jgi:DHA2 family methylenomycin A resistance protein-like MFS transporter
VIGPVLGGGLVAAFGWRAVFLVNLPVTVAIGVLVGRTVRETPQAAGGGLDLPGQVLGAAALGLLAAGAIEGGKHGFAAALPLGLFAGGAASLAAFIRVERRRAHPTNLTARLAGGVFGVAVLGPLLSAGGSGGADQAFTHGLHTAMIAAPAVALAGAVLTAAFIPGKAPAGASPGQ